MDKTKRNWVEGKDLAKKVINFYKNQAKEDTKTTWHFFKQEGIPKTNVHCYIKRFKDSKNIQFKKPSGRTAKVGTTKVKNRIKKSTKLIHLL